MIAESRAVKRDMGASWSLICAAIAKAGAAVSIAKGDSEELHRGGNNGGAIEFR